jgi:hypothetical protein
MVERLATLTDELRSQRRKGYDFNAFSWLIAKHSERVRDAEAESARFEQVAPKVPAFLKAAVAAGTTDVTAWGGSLSTYNTASREWIMEYAPTLFDALSCQPAPNNDSIIADSSKNVGRFVAEGAPIPLSIGNFTRTRAMVQRRVAALAVVTDELIRSFGENVCARASAD